MQAEVKRRIVWFSVFMVWIGMVGAILIFQEANPGALPSVAEPMNEPQSSVEQSTDQVTTENTTPEASTTQQADPAQLPTVKESNNADFFVQHRLEMDKVRSDLISMYRETINNPNTDPAIKKVSQEKLLQIQEAMEQEIKVEGLIKLKGYSNAIVSISGDNTSINVIVRSDGLTEEDVAKIYDIIAQVTKIRAENVTIINI